MEDMKLAPIESRFADIIWRSAPLPSGQLVSLCLEELHWKKSTTYTVLKKLCQRGIFQNEDGLITPLISREDYYAMQSEKFVEESFDGSLPAFLAAFTSRKGLTPEEIDEIRRMIRAYEEG